MITRRGFVGLLLALPFAKRWVPNPGVARHTVARLALKRDAYASLFNPPADLAAAYRAGVVGPGLVGNTVRMRLPQRYRASDTLGKIMAYAQEQNAETYRAVYAQHAPAPDSATQFEDAGWL